MGDNIKIGWAEADITPDGVVDLCGQYYHRVSRGVHSRLSATVLALDSGHGGHCVMVSMDLVGFKSDFLEELRAMVRRELPDMDVSRLILNATHTHSAPGVNLISGIGWLKELPDVLPVSKYRSLLLGRLKTLVADAWRARAPGGVAAAFASARVGHCRRAVYSDNTAEMYGDTGRQDFVGMEGGEDSGVELLFTFDPERRPTGVVLNLACPSQVMEATYKISADYIGEARRLLKGRFGGGFRVLAQISAAGCQSPRDLARNYKGAEPDFWREDGVAELGIRVFEAVSKAADSVSGVDFSPAMRHEVSKVSLPVRRVSGDEVRKASAELARLESATPEDEAYKAFCDEVARNEKIPGRPGPYDSKLHHFVLIQNNKAVLERAGTQDKSPFFEMELHVVRVGDNVFVTNPFELYLDFGQQMKARSPARQTFVVQLACGGGGYLPGARAEELGGYGGLVINGSVGSEGGKILVDETVGAIEKIWS